MFPPVSATLSVKAVEAFLTYAPGFPICIGFVRLTLSEVSKYMRVRIILPSFILPLCLLGLLFGVSPMRSGASSQGQDRVSAAQLAAALDAQKQADAKLTRSESAERRFQALSAQLQQTDGTAPVIIQLAVAFRPEGEIQTEAERLAQREAIRQAQDELLNLSLIHI